MCGIAGFVSPGQDPAAARRAVQAMTARIAHRGPDGEGVFADGRAALGHRRLAIVDLAGGGQRMCSEDGSLVLDGDIVLYGSRPLATIPPTPATMTTSPCPMT